MCSTEKSTYPLPIRSRSSNSASGSEVAEEAMVELFLDYVSKVERERGSVASGEVG